MSEKRNKYQEVGILLQNRRRDNGVEVEKIAADLILKTDYINQLEQGNYDKISKKIYYYGYVGAIARYLQSPGEELDVKLLNYLINDEAILHSQNLSESNDANVDEVNTEKPFNDQKVTYFFNKNIFLIIAIGLGLLLLARFITAGPEVPHDIFKSQDS